MNRRLTSAMVLSFLITAGLTACQKTEPTTEGPAEQVGQKIDEAASKASVHLNAIAEKAGQGLAKAGEKLEQSAKEAQQKNEEQKADASK